MGDTVPEREFRQFVHQRQQELGRSAYALCGNWHDAQDLTQTALLELYAVWGTVRCRSTAVTYARVLLARADTTHRRRAGAGEEPVREVPEPGTSRDPASGTDLSLMLRAALMTVPPRCRAVLVLRFWGDWSVERTARALGMSTGTVKSHTARGLHRLRQAVERMDIRDPGSGMRGQGFRGRGPGPGRGAGGTPFPAVRPDGARRGRAVQWVG
ncbi:SigE family RNA polymerase sigma factor [Streptomyces hirsutus]|uniref:SigE family RNA polymerase sigma factor n=1 Tax=Streptomyces hirsutus TaxID=35620 RepID=UPI0007C78448